MQGKKTSHIWSPPPKAYKDIPFSFLFFWLGGQIQNRFLSPEYCPEKHKEKWVHKMQEKKKKYLHCRRYLWGLKSAGGLNYRSTE